MHLVLPAIHLPKSNGSLAVAIKLEAKEIFCFAALSFFTATKN
jgi:hypothetical protein